MSVNPGIKAIVTKLQHAEFSGVISKTLEHGGRGEFALLLSMLQQDVSRRLSFSEEPEKPIQSYFPIESLNFYPQVPLATEPKHYMQQSAFAEAIHRQDVTTATLLGCMFPSPLSLHNDAKRVPEEVIANCDIYAQCRLQTEKEELNKDNQIDVDPTLLYETIASAQAIEAA